MRVRGVGLLSVALLVLAAAACSLPSRDNPNEPSRRPIADLVAIVSTGAPPDCAPSGAWPDVDHVTTVGAVYRGTCVALDARRSRDPHDRPLRFEFHGPDGAVLASATNGIATISLAQLRALAIDSAHTFSVTVDNLSNPPTTATVDLIVKDHAPTVTADVDRTLPAGGYPWALGSAFQVTFHADGKDPDAADAALLDYCWTVPPSGEQCGQPATIVRAIPTRVGYYPIAVRADDGVLSSPTAFEALRVDDPNLWGVPGGYGTLERLDGLRRGWNTSAASMDGAVLFDDGVKPLVVGIGFNSDGSILTEARSWPDLQPVSGGAVTIPWAMNVTPTRAKLSADVAGRRIWAAGLDEPGTRHFVPTLHAYSVDANGALTLAIPIATPWGNEGANTIDEGLTIDLGAVDGAGNGWVSRSFGIKVYARDPQGDSFSSPVPDLGTGLAAQVQGLAARPDSTEMWALVRFQISGADTTPEAPAFLWRLSGPGDTGVAFPLADYLAAGFAFADHDRAWVYSEEHGLMLLDVSAIEAGGDPASAVLVDAPDPVVSRADAILADPVTGAALVRDDIAGVVWTVRTDGSVSSTPGATTPLFVDGAGLTWSNPGSGPFGSVVQAGEGASADGSLVHAPSTRDATAYDWSTGGVWGAFIDPTSDGLLIGGYSLYDQRGDAVRTFTTMDVGGVIRRPPAPALLHASDDGTVLWAVGMVQGGIAAGTPNDIWTLDVTTDPPTGRLALSTLAKYRKGVEPLTSDPHKAWTVQLSTATDVPSSVTLLSDSGVDTPVFSIPLAEFNPPSAVLSPIGARARGDDSLCLATTVPGGVEHWRLITTSGVVTDLQAFALASTSSVPIVAASVAPGGDVCWFVIHDSGGTDAVYGQMGAAITRFYGESESPIASLEPVSARVVYVALANGHHYRLEWADDTTPDAPAVTSIGSDGVTSLSDY